MDKELALILAELLIKQDETTLQIKGINSRLDGTNDRLDQVVGHLDHVVGHLDHVVDRLDQTVIRLDETNSILKDFMAVSVKQWQQQQTFNELFAKELSGIKEILSTAIQLEARVKAVEERENNFELRLSHIEKLLKAS